MGTCGLTRLLSAAFAAGFATTSVTGHEGHGWIAAALTVLAVVVVRHLRGASASCARPHGVAGPVADHDERRPGLDLEGTAVEAATPPAEPLRPGRRSVTATRGSRARHAVAASALTVVLAACSVGYGPSRWPPNGTSPAHGAPPVVRLADGVAVVPVEGSVTDVHDPDVVREGRLFHLFSTGSWIDHRTSTDLVHWRRAPSVFDGPPPWVTTELGYRPYNLWAPDLSWWGGTWHLYYAASEWVPGELPTRNSVIAHATSPTLDPRSPRYGWVDHGAVVRSQGGFGVDFGTGWNAIDPEVVLDRGRPWLAWGSSYGGLFLQRLRSDGHLDPTIEPVNIARRAPNPALVIEASTIVRRGGWWYLFASYDLCCLGTNSTYNVRVGRSRSLTGPYRDRDGRSMTDGGGTKVLTAHGDVVGPGGQSILEVRGRWWISYHWYDPAHDGRATLGISPLDWDDQGWPQVRGWSPAVAAESPRSGLP